MVLYGIWLIDGSSGLLLAHTTVQGFTFNPDLFSGFITAAHEFAREASGSKLQTIILGNFKLLLHRGKVGLIVLAVGVGDPEARYDSFFIDVESKAEPILTREHRKPFGFKVVSQPIRSALQEIIRNELDCFVTRKAPSDLSDIGLLQEKSVQKLLRTLLEQKITVLVPEPVTTEVGYSYPVAKNVTGLSDSEIINILERLAEFGILLKEPIDTALCCPHCGSYHIHPRILCPSCKFPAQPANLYEHLTCGNVDQQSESEKKFQCSRCGNGEFNEQEFRSLRGYNCSHCKASFKNPHLLFTCHNCRKDLEPEDAKVKVLHKYIVNPALIPELQFHLSIESSSPSSASTANILRRKSKVKGSTRQETDSLPLRQVPKITINELNTVELPQADHQLISNAGKLQTSSNRAPIQASSVSITKNEDELALQRKLVALEGALDAGEISEAEYDRKFIQLRLQIRRLKSVS